MKRFGIVRRSVTPTTSWKHKATQLNRTKLLVSRSELTRLQGSPLLHAKTEVHRFIRDSRTPSSKSHFCSQTKNETAFEYKPVEGFPPVVNNGILNQYVLSNKCNEALEFFKQMQAHKQTNRVTYSIMMKMFRKEPLQMVQIFKEMQKDGFSPDVISYTQLINSFGQKGQINEMMAFYKDFKDNNFTASTSMYMSMMEALLLHGQKNQIHALMNEVKSVGTKRVLYNKMIKVVGSKRDLNEVKYWITDMDKRKVVPNKETYEAIFEGFGVMDVKNVMQLIAEMKKSGIQIDENVYNAVMSNFTHDDATAAMEVLKKMKEDGITPTATSYNTLLRMQKDLASMKDLYEDMKRNNIHPNIHTFNFLIYKSVASQRGEDINMWFDEMNAYNVERGSDTFVAIIKGFADIKDVNNMNVWKKECFKSGDVLGPNAFNDLISAYYSVNEYEECWKLFREMRNNGMFLNPTTAKQMQAVAGHLNHNVDIVNANFNSGKRTKGKFD